MTRICFILCVIALVLLTVSCDTSANGVNAGSEIDSSVVSPNLETLDTFDDIQVGFTADGYPFRGSPEAPVTIVEYSDYLCPFCGRYTSETAPILLDEYVRTGKVKFVFRDFPIATLHPTAHFGHIAANCAGKQGAVQYWKMHDALFALQNDWNQLPNPVDYLINIAQEINLNMSDFRNCLNDGDNETEVNDSVEIAVGLGFNATPSFQFIRADSEEVYPFVGAQPTDVFRQWIESLAVGNEPPIDPTPEPPKPPPWTEADNLEPNPDKPGYTIGGDPYKGVPGAKLVVIEFMDYECPACRTHAIETQPIIDEQFVNSGQVMWVVKNLPLKEHTQAPVAAAAAECAGDQGKFWPMYNLIFENQSQWAGSDSDSFFISFADQLDLDVTAFQNCLNSRDALLRVLSDMYDAEDLVGTTPTFIFIYNDRASAFSGALDAEQFIQLIEDLLLRTTSADTES